MHIIHGPLAVQCSGICKLCHHNAHFDETKIKLIVMYIYRKHSIEILGAVYGHMCVLSVILVCLCGQHEFLEGIIQLS